MDSDFDLDSSEGEEEYIEEGKALDKQIERAEKKVGHRAPYYQGMLPQHLIHLVAPGSDFQSASSSCDQT